MANELIQYGLLHLEGFYVRSGRCPKHLIMKDPAGILSLLERFGFVTDWFPGTMEPKNSGVYQVRIPDSPRPMFAEYHEPNVRWYEPAISPYQASVHSRDGILDTNPYAFQRKNNRYDWRGLNINDYQNREDLFYNFHRDENRFKRLVKELKAKEANELLKKFTLEKE
jgi:hypothetical protein